MGKKNASGELNTEKHLNFLALKIETAKCTLSWTELLLKREDCFDPVGFDYDTEQL